MKTQFVEGSGCQVIPRLILSLVIMVAAPAAVASIILVNLNEAADYAVLSGAGITITGPTTITGDIGSSPTPTITGLENLTLTGVNHANDPVSQQAQEDLSAAYTDAAGRAATTIFDDVFDLGGLTLSSGVYRDNTSFALTGVLTLDAGGDEDAVWIFQAGSTLITAVNSTVTLIGGAQAHNIFWQVGSSATIGAGSEFSGTIMALQSITLNTGASVDGRLLAQHGAVTLDNNYIVVPIPESIPEPSTAGLLGLGLLAIVFRRRPYSEN